MDEEQADLASRVRVVLVTVSDADAGCILARRLVGEHLAACGNVIPGLTSVYRWEGRVQEEGEALVLLKTTEEALSRLKKRVLELHEYEVPEFLVLPITGGHSKYIRWVTEEVGSFEVSE